MSRGAAAMKVLSYGEEEEEEGKSAAHGSYDAFGVGECLSCCNGGCTLS